MTNEQTLISFALSCRDAGPRQGRRFAAHQRGVQYGTQRCADQPSMSSGTFSRDAVVAPAGGLPTTSL
jgi:hypothetical protein